MSAQNRDAGVSRREFGLVLGGLSGFSGLPAASGAVSNVPSAGPKTPACVKVIFAYPPSARLQQEGYYSWPGSGFDAEGRQAQYTKRLEEMGRELNLRIEVQKQALDLESEVEPCLASIRQAGLDGLVLVPLKKSHFDHVVRILDGAGLPAVIFAHQGILLNAQIQKVNRRAGVYLINSLDNFEALRMGLKMIQAAHRMRESRLVKIDGAQRGEAIVPSLGTTVITVPHQVFYDAFARTGATPEVQALAQRYWKTAIKRVEPSPEDVLEAAKTYFVLKQIAEREGADAIMMNCLPGLRRPHKHVPPCMGFMTLRDEGIPAGCEADLDATLTMMIIQYLFDKPAFQHNPSMDTEKNRYFGAHCTSPSRMHGPNGPAEPYILRNHAEAGWGCVPQVLFRAGQKVTFAKYLSGQTPRMLIYGGTIQGCLDNPPCGGCRTNVEIAVDELDDATQVRGHHLCLFYGQHAGHLRTFCQLMKIERAS